MGQLEIVPYARAGVPEGYPFGWREPQQVLPPQIRGEGGAPREPVAAAGPGPAVGLLGVGAYRASDLPQPGNWVDLWA